MWQDIKEAFHGGIQEKKYKRCGTDYIVEMTLLQDQTKRLETNEDRLVTDKRFAKFRANYLFVNRIYNTVEKRFYSKLEHRWTSKRDDRTSKVEYIENQFVYATDWDPNIDTICGPGIHYFNTLIAAFFYVELFPDDFFDKTRQTDESNEMSFAPDGSLYMHSIRPENGNHLTDLSFSDMYYKLINKYHLSNILFFVW